MDYKEAIEALRLEGGLEIEGNLEKVAKFFDGLDTAIQALKEIQEYKKFGDFEEVRDAVEKQKAKKPIVERIDERIFGRKVENVVVYCPICGHPIGSLVDIVMHGFCRNCGQHIDWSEEYD